MVESSEVAHNQNGIAYNELFWVMLLVQPTAWPNVVALEKGEAVLVHCVLRHNAHKGSLEDQFRYAMARHELPVKEFITPLVRLDEAGRKSLHAGMADDLAIIELDENCMWHFQKSGDALPVLEEWCDRISTSNFATFIPIMVITEDEP